MSSTERKVEEATQLVKKALLTLRDVGAAAGGDSHKHAAPARQHKRRHSRSKERDDYADTDGRGSQPKEADGPAAVADRHPIHHRHRRRERVGGGVSDTPAQQAHHGGGVLQETQQAPRKPRSSSRSQLESYGGDRRRRGEVVDGASAVALGRSYNTELF